MSEPVAGEPLPLREQKTIRVKVRFIGDILPVPYPIDDDDLKALNELE
jgi:hypothetical protein